MSVESTQRELNQIDKDIASIEKKSLNTRKRNLSVLSKIGRHGAALPKARAQAQQLLRCVKSNL